MVNFVSAICRNPQCGNVWFFEKMFPGATVFITRSIASSCPKCGFPGDIPDGLYTDFSTDFFRPDQLKKVHDALVSLSNKVEKGATIEDVQQEIKTNPALEFLSGYKIKDWKDLNECFKSLTYISAVLLVIYSLATTGTISIPNDVVTVFRDWHILRDTPRDTQHDDRKHDIDHMPPKTIKPTTPTPSNTPLKLKKGLTPEDLGLDKHPLIPPFPPMPECSN